MNERIRELAKALAIGTIGNWGRVEWKDNVYPQLGDKLYAAIDLEKFTELIVRECAELTLDYKNEAHYNGWLDHCDAIKKHFGVEE